MIIQNFFLFAALLLPSAFCLYEDQVGKFDWKLSYIGKAKFASFGGKRVYVATEDNVIASLQVSTGDISWRQTLEKQSDNQIYLLHLEKDTLVVTVSGNKNLWYVRGWEAATGMLQFEWTVPGGSEDVNWSVIDGELHQIKIITKSHLEVVSYELQSGKTLEDSRKIPGVWSKDCLQTNRFFVCLSQDDFKFKLSYVDIVDRESVVRYNEGVKESGRKAEIMAAGSGFLMVKDGLGYVFVENENNLEIVKDLHIESPNIRLVEADGKLSLMQLEVNPDNPEKLLRVVSYDLDETRRKSVVDVPYPLGLGAPYSIAASFRNSVCDVLLSSSDSALTLLRLPEGKIMWTREEALSHIVATEFLELPVSELDASIEREFEADGDILSMLYRRLLSQSKQLSAFFTDNPLLTSQNGLVRDEFGLHKLIVVATNAGKLFALDTLSGTIVWSYRLPNVVPFTALDKPTMMIFVQRSARYAPFPAHCMLIAKDAHTGNAVIFRFDPITGHSRGGIERLNYKIKQAVLLPHEDDNHLKPVLILSESNTVHVSPVSMTEVISQEAMKTFLYEFDTTTNQLQGYNLKHSDSAFTARAVWNVSFGASEVVAVSVRPSNERVHSQGRVLPDRSVYYKYVNPNMIAVATLGQDPVHKHVLNVLLVDGVTGLVLHSANHKRARGPVHLVHSENWLVYSYYSERFRRIEVAAVELYEGFIQNNSSYFSSFAVSQLPHAESQAYILPSTPLTMTTTLTERGITTKFLLIALSNGIVTEIPWLLLQPRLPNVACGPEESCIPYMPEIPLVPEASVNYNRTLERIRGISVAPARLESNCHVLVHGLDVFYTRVAPSKTFDVLKEDFDHRLIVLVLSALIIASYVAKRLASRKALKQAWK